MSESRACILIVEDDDGIARAVETVMERAGMSTTRARNGAQALSVFYEARCDLVILDLGLPVMDGWQVLKRLREVSDVPILILTARDLEHDKVRGLLSGADDYLTKPFAVRELSARVEALLRRSRRRPRDEVDQFVDGDLEIDFVLREVRVGSSEVALTPLEFRLLEVLVRHPRQALSNEQLLDLAWDDPLGIAPDRVKFTVLRLRRKLGFDDVATSPIESVRGFGYRYRPVGTRN